MVKGFSWEHQAASTGKVHNINLVTVLSVMKNLNHERIVPIWWMVLSLCGGMEIMHTSQV